MDVFSTAERSKIMARVRAKNTEPERRVVEALRLLRSPYRCHNESLPGTPDIVVPSKRVALFVNGCFWHQHRNCEGSEIPSSNTAYWKRKLAGNVRRDRRNARQLRSMGWRVSVIWECRAREKASLRRRLEAILRRSKILKR